MVFCMKYKSLCTKNQSIEPIFLRIVFFLLVSFLVTHTYIRNAKLPWEVFDYLIIHSGILR